MKAAYKVTVLVAVQIALIIASFLAIVHFESQTGLAGNIVNVAGKNRAMAGMVLIELNHAIYNDRPQDGVRDSLGALSENILLLRQGSDTAQIRTFPLPERFAGDWSAIYEKFSQYEDEVLHAISQDRGEYPAMISSIERTAGELVYLSDLLTEKLGHDVDALSSQLIMLQVAMGAVNVAVHIVMISLIWKILDRHAREKARTERLATIGEFASSMAHNLQNPLGAIKNSATRIRHQGELEQVRRDEVARIDRCIRRMSHQIEDVMNHVRTPPLALTDRPVSDMLGSALEMAHMPENVSVSCPENDAAIRCDDAKLEVVFVNILRNAAQAMGDTGGSIRIKLDLDGSGATIMFENSGPPIPESDLPRIFEPLYTTKMDGTGLGLSSCQNIIEKHRGSISVSCNRPVTFSVFLPRDPEAAPAAPGQAG